MTPFLPFAFAALIVPANAQITDKLTLAAAIESHDDVQAVHVFYCAARDRGTPLQKSQQAQALKKSEDACRKTAGCRVPHPQPC